MNHYLKYPNPADPSQPKRLDYEVLLVGFRNIKNGLVEFFRMIFK